MDQVVTIGVLVGSDCNVDVGSNMDKVFQIVVRARGWVNPQQGGGGWKFCWGDIFTRW